MVTCSELATIVTTQENSFLVWGSRPYVKSPLHTSLSQSESSHSPSHHSDIKTSKRKESDPLFLPAEPSSPSERVTRGHHRNPSVAGSGSRERMHKSSSLNLTNTPHTMTTCNQASQYIKVLTQLLLEPVGSGKVGRGEGGMGRRMSVSSEVGGGGVEKEGVILEPTSVDLVGRCGLLSDLSAQGLQQAKLEGVSNFAGNVLILVEAKVPEEEVRGEGQRLLKVTPPKQPLLMMSKRLIERRHWSKYVS